MCLKLLGSFSCNSLALVHVLLFLKVCLCGDKHLVLVRPSHKLRCICGVSFEVCCVSKCLVVFRAIYKLRCACCCFVVLFGGFKSVCWCFCFVCIFG